MKARGVSNALISLEEAGGVFVQHRWSGGLYTGCSCGSWPGKSEPISFPRHVAKSIFDHFGIAYELEAEA